MKNKYKTLSVFKEIYDLVIERQQELMKKKGEYVEINYVAGSAILLGIDKVE